LEETLFDNAPHVPRPAIAVALFLAVACGHATAQSADPSALLADLARSLGEARSGKAKSPGVRCPANAGTLAGVPIGRVLVELGQPDPVPNAKENTATYVFGRAGAPEITFRFDNQGVVKSVECRPGR
jgi:hypothetical protein